MSRPRARLPHSFMMAMCAALVGAPAGAQPVGSQPASRPQNDRTEPVPPGAEAGPRLVLSQAAWDFGIVRHPAKPELVLTVKNEGTAELRITKVQSSCGCIAVAPGKDALAPGEATTLKVTYDTQGRQGQTGSQVHISSNDRLRPELVFPVRGFIQRAVEMHPFGGLSFKALEAGEVRTQAVRLLNREPEPLHPQLKGFASGRFGAELRELRPGQEYELVVTTRPPLPREVTRDTLEIQTGLAAEPTLTLAVQAQLVDRVHLVPPVLYIRKGDAEGGRRVVQLEYFGDDPQFRVTGVACAHPGVTATVGAAQALPPGEPGKLAPRQRVLLDVFLPPGAQVPGAGVAVNIATSDPEYPEVRIVVTSDVNVFGAALRHAQSTSQRRITP